MHTPKSLNYEIDILPRDMGGETPLYMAAFRDPVTAWAARATDPAVISALLDAGIALDCYASGAPEGYYPQAHTGARAYLAACLEEAMAEEGIEPRDEVTGFDLRLLVEELVGAKPYGAVVPVAEEPVADVGMPAPVYVAISVMAVAGYMAGFAVIA